MCGIFVSLSRDHHVQPTSKTYDLLRNRGPDCVKELQFKSTPIAGAVDEHLGDDEERAQSTVYITCLSTVLSLRSQQAVSQPLTIEHETTPFTPAHLLCWNGEAWTLGGSDIRGNDSEHVFRLLNHVSNSVSDDSCTSHEQVIAEALALLAGPYAFALFDQSRRRLYFGRDLLGRRSLLIKVASSGDLVISSVSDSTSSEWREVEADGVYWIDLDARHDNGSFLIQRTDYHYGEDGVLADRNLSLRQLKLDRELPSPEDQELSSLSSSSQSVTALERLLRRALSLRIRDIFTYSVTHDASNTLQAARLGVLFSGGLDCTVLARLAHDVLRPDEPIDLMNVAFENPRVHKSPKGADTFHHSPYELCPDRITGRASFLELQRTCPNREWRFVAVNVPYAETLAHRLVITQLIHPHNTEMDLSIACALYFAARGKGELDSSNGPSSTYTTAARVLLSGLGADELFGGYTRHSTAFSRKSYVGLLDELELDVGRLGKRNLGRDDRVISTWSREARFPFLDECLVNWALRIPIWKKCGFGEKPSECGSTDGSETLDPSKKVLRCLAWRLGMMRVANEKKRAIQFGARTAKMEVGRTKGTQVIARSN